MKTLLKIGDFLTSRNFNLGFYAFFTGFFGENAVAYLSKGHIGWGLLFLAVSLYDLFHFYLWLTDKKVVFVNKSVRLEKRYVKKESV